MEFTWNLDRKFFTWEQQLARPWVTCLILLGPPGVCTLLNLPTDLEEIWSTWRRAEQTLFLSLKMRDILWSTECSWVRQSYRKAEHPYHITSFVPSTTVLCTLCYRQLDASGCHNFEIHDTYLYRPLDFLQHNIELVGLYWSRNTFPPTLAYYLPSLLTKCPSHSSALHPS